MASRDLYAARKAYESGDIERSRKAHERGTIPSVLPSSSSSSSSLSSSSSSLSSASSPAHFVSPPVTDKNGLTISTNPSNPLLSSSTSLSSSRSNSSSSLSTNTNNDLLRSSSSSSSFSSSSISSTTSASVGTTSNNMELNSPIANTTPSMCEPGHQTDTPFGKTFISGALDGASTAVILCIIFSILSIDYSLTVRIMYSIGISLSIAFSLREYMKLTWDYMIYERERKREAWELDNFPDGERREMIELYMSHGVTETDAVQVIKTLSYYPDFFVSLMMAQELRMAQPESTPWNLALANFLGFNIFYFIPLGIIYLYFFLLQLLVPSLPLHTDLVWLWSLPTVYTTIPSLNTLSFTGIVSSTDLYHYFSVLFLHIPPCFVMGSIFILVWILFHFLRITTLPIYKHTNTSINIGTTGIIAATVAGLLAYGISPILELRTTKGIE